MIKLFFKKNEKLSDAQIVRLMTGTEEERGRGMDAFLSNPELATRAREYVKSKGGNEQDGEDVFMNAFVEFEKIVRNGQFRTESSLSTFFQGIVKKKWLEQRRVYSDKSGKLPVLPEESEENIVADLISAEYKVMIGGFISQIGDRCKDLLALYKLEYSMEEIAGLAGFANSNVAGKEVFKCRKRLRESISNHPELDNILETFNLKNYDSRKS